jgi:hypothetical protein
MALIAARAALQTGEMQRYGSIANCCVQQQMKQQATCQGDTSTVLADSLLTAAWHTAKAN